MHGGPLPQARTPGTAVASGQGSGPPDVRPARRCRSNGDGAERSQGPRWAALTQPQLFGVQMLCFAGEPTLVSRCEPELGVEHGSRCV